VRSLTYCFILLLSIALLASQASAHENGEVIAVHVQDVITQATYEEVAGALNLAKERGCPLLILLNTPGGSLDVTIKLVEQLLNSPIPVVVYVYPRGATAWSAGSFILLASHIAAMSPGTVVGSAQPVSYSPFTGSEPITESKVLNAVAEYVEEVARARGRNATAARLFVTENLNLGGSEALQIGVIDLLASDVDELLAELEGVVVEVDGQNYTLRTQGAALVMYEGGIRITIMSLLSNPLLASIMFLAGLYGLIFGLAYAQPASAVIGGLLVILSLIGLGFNVNIVSILLVMLGVLLLFIELFVIPGFGAIGMTGIVMMVIGALLSPLSIDPSQWAIHPEWYNKLAVISLAIVAPLLAFSVFALYKVLKAKRLRPKLYIAGLVGQEAIALDELGPGKEGFVRCAGEYWAASSDEYVKPGERVIVVGKEGSKLIVKRIEGEEEGVRDES